MIPHSTITDRELKNHLKNRQLLFGGNPRLKIYGTLHCASGRRMKKENRVFFASELEALQLGFRPCGHCMRAAYVDWKRINQQS
jgi:methylphosphotriester-DNA--protein-cysteine methyltransferase